MTDSKTAVGKRGFYIVGEGNDGTGKSTQIKQLAKHIEKEFGMYYYDLKSEVLSNRELSILRNFPNVIVTPHMAFYTDNAIASMVENSLRSCKCFMEGSENPWEVA